ncbi:MAG TPA: macro domain-containing protein [Solirubrobacteraceae bacterium]|nr:macro domain-containing protein [Solirubrobacteraceae bacterium]
MRDRGCEAHGGRAPARPLRDPRGRAGLAGGGGGEAELLASCYRRAVALADAHAVEVLALPAISTGVYGYPLAAAAGVAIEAVRSALAEAKTVAEARFWLFDAPAYEAFAAALEATGGC